MHRQERLATHYTVAWGEANSVPLPSPIPAAADLYAVARQYRLLQQQYGAALVRYEDAMQDFDAAWRPVLQRFWPQASLRLHVTCLLTSLGRPAGDQR